MGLMCRAQWMTQWVGFKMQSSHPVCFFSYFLPVIRIDYLLLDYGQLRMPTTTSHTNTQTMKGGQILDSEACSFLSTTVSMAPTTTALNDDKWGSMERLDGSIRLEIAGEFLFNDFL